MRYSGLAVLAQGLTGNKGWRPAWRDPAPKDAYDIVIIGGGGHGLATAYYLAKEHGLKNIAVLEKGYLGGGNVGRNTTIVRANYGLPGNSEFYSHSLKLWEGLEARPQLQRDAFPARHHQPLPFRRPARRLCTARQRHDQPGRRRDPSGHRGRAQDRPLPRFRADALPDLRRPLPPPRRHRAPRRGGLGLRAGADQRGVDLIQNCEVTGIDIEGGRVTGVQTSRGAIRAKKVGIVVAGRSSQVAAMAGMRIPIESHVLQAFVTEGLKPVIDTVITYGMGHFYISQSDKGGLVFGGDLDFYASYAARGNLPMAEHVVEAGLTLMPMIGKAKMLRSWGGIMDMSPDGSPIIDKTHIEGLYLNCGWCYGGFKAVPGSGNVFAHLIATDRPHEAATRYRLDRFATGRGLMDEEATGSQHNLH
jgi:glycine/D-amino acid oxidase-like deaminating enzyme